jgi:hypothetical protein
MGIGVSIFLLAVGAILSFAVEAEAEGIDIQTVGVILMVVGGLGVLFSLIYWSSWGGWGNSGSFGVRRRVVVDQPQVVQQQPRVVVQQPPRVVVNQPPPAGYVVDDRRDV